MPLPIRPLAVVTGASTGIGFELAKCCALNGFDLIVAADEPSINQAAKVFERYGRSAQPVEADLATEAGVDRLYAATMGRPVEALLANAGRGLGNSFLEQDFCRVRHVIDTNITGTIYLIRRVGKDMHARGRGRIMITGSIAGFVPGAYSAVYNGTKAFLDSFSYALRAELKDSGVTVTCLMPGLTDTEFFERAQMQDTILSKSTKDDPAEVAAAGFQAMMRGHAGVVTGWKSRLQSAFVALTPPSVLAEQFGKRAQPGRQQASTSRAAVVERAPH
jgi:short-subunit dehydrogenase